MDFYRADTRRIKKTAMSKKQQKKGLTGMQPTMKTRTSDIWYARAQNVIIGGVNSPSRSYKAVGGGTPRFFVRGEGAYLFDVDDNRYIDYLAAYGPLILGHAHPKIKEALLAVSEEGTLFGTSTPYEVQFAEMLREAIPSMERIRLTNSGTEAVMTTVRVARAYTGRSKILKFQGSYHGHFDDVLVAAGSGPATLGTPDSAGVLQSVAQEVVTTPYNDISSYHRALETYGAELAAVLIEPIIGNFGIVPPDPDFIQAVHQGAKEVGALVIYDEVITAFRFHYGSVQSLFNARADLTALGKIIGGGLPIGAYGGRRDIMEWVAPLGPAYQAGTMAGNPASVRAGMATLHVLKTPGVYEDLTQKASTLVGGLQALAETYRIPLTVNQYRGAFSTHFTDRPVRTYQDADEASSDLYARFFHGMLERGILLAPSKFEAWFTMLPHSEEDLAFTLNAAEDVFKAMRTQL
ncbi:MAG: Glutamate-1-semialdehyde aminotransferase [Candidatus Carbobacillus altaicus]|uniref:Glutamate-1-semialdehyde 2,1-aminomutase n=1 Tax=Candidatus Carbonibacillus altaicus TaxID=2163959 RepID=A0A2R6Y0E8_9BACL|nr:MAG: Glutamate-1-semialdehyde aminotransferase [Candidatus Carbobacillus altaicus]